MTSTTTVNGVTVEAKYFSDPLPKATRKGRMLANEGAFLTAHAGRHTCGTADPGVICAACEWTVARLLEGDDQSTAVASADDVLAQTRRHLSLDAFGGGEGGLLDTWQADRISDPQRAYDADTDVLRGAFRIAQADKRTSGAVRAVVAQVAATRPDTFGMTPKGVAVAMRRWAVPSFVRADAKAVRRAVVAAVPQAAAEAAEALRPDGPSAERWAVRAAPDAATYAGPIAHTMPGRPAWVVTPEGEVTRGEAVASTRCYAQEVKFRKDPETGEQVRECTVTPLAWMTRADALQPQAFWSYGSAWRADKGSLRADAFALKRRPTSDETADPLAPVRKPSNRKRKRDGAMGGPAVITHR
jgi:hypothetical protein